MKRFHFLLGRVLKKRHEGIFRHIPLKTQGKLFTSPMPSGAYDKRNQLLKIYKMNGIDHVFVLVTDEELQKKARRNLLQEYEKRGMTYSRYIMEDFQAPSVEIINNLVEEAVKRLFNKEHILIHCHAGVGRTSVAASCVAITIEGMTTRGAIDHIKAHMMVNITTEQKNVIQKFETLLQDKPS